ncbi:LacI family DNA-binding transcriptional regulator [Anaerocolumna sp. MB42-C2]|uniref:LacI family DNA-binding transcriptional regulator n=1 Tax=Anaerocolumna sp. MB42-C2 TaxID=3070997 RepID=UPI0027DFD3A5|nr:LacI family DNA-binding transcriptional regulator [Anaerocolumna sp. MB42-C2]WMJ89376.1 LacI family DNA-binding transcriptional regulator [Anaerocolumna sp. MB42-C2]
MVSMKDISVVCGVSVATVSKALNGHKDIGEETKRLVRETAKEMGYFPNSSARTLKTNRSYNLGVLMIDEANSGLTHDHFVMVLESLKVSAERHGYDITFISGSKQRKDKMSYLEHCRYRGLDGVVIACIDYDEIEVLELIHSDLPVVTIDHLFNDRTAVMSDNIKGIRELFNYVYECGHRKIAYIHGAGNAAVTKNRLHSFYKIAEEYGLDIPDEYIRESAYRDTVTTARLTNELLELSDPPTCILFPDDYAGLGGMNAIKARGLKIPKDISVAGYDGIRITKILEPQLTTINQDTIKLGQYAAEKLIDLIERPKTTFTEHIIVPGVLDKGATVSKLK